MFAAQRACLRRSGSVQLLFLLALPWAVAYAAEPALEQLAIPYMGSIDIPISMEVQGEFLRSLARQRAAEPDDPSLMSEVKIQQAGLNAGRPEAMSRYMRILISTSRTAPDRVGTLDSARSLTTDDLNAFASEISEAAAALGGKTGSVLWHPPKVRKVGNAYAICVAYTRQGEQGPVLVAQYTIFNYDRLHKVTVAYRASEASVWSADIDAVLAGMRIEDAAPGAAVPARPHIRGPNEPTVLRELVGDVFRESPRNPSALGDLLAYVAIAALLTWGIGLAPPLVVRFIVLRRPIERRSALLVVAALFVANLALFTSLGSRSKTHAALFFVAVVSYHILRKSARQSPVPPTRGDETPDPSAE